MATTLGIIDDGRYKYRLGWFADGEEGGWLGQDPRDGKGTPPVDRDSWEHWAASKAVGELTSTERDVSGFYWESDKAARFALRAAKLALKHKRPLPSWAKTAIANGWKPPKGWKP